MSFAQNLKNELYYQDISIKELSHITKIAYTTLFSYTKSNYNVPKIENALKIASALNVSIEYLYYGQDINTSKDKIKINSIITDLNLLPLSIRSQFESFIHSIAEIYSDENRHLSVEN